MNRMKMLKTVLFIQGGFLIHKEGDEKWIIY